MFAMWIPDPMLVIALAFGLLIAGGVGWWRSQPETVAERDTIFGAARTGTINTLVFNCSASPRIIGDSPAYVVATVELIGMDGRKKKFRHVEAKTYTSDAQTGIEAVDEIPQLTEHALRCIVDDVYGCHLRRYAPSLQLTLRGFGNKDGTYTEPAIIRSLATPLEPETIELSPVRVTEPESTVDLT